VRLVTRDRFGLGWRPALAAGILAHLDRVDVLEVVAEECAAASKASRRALRALGRAVPVHVHAVSLGLASTAPVDRRALDTVARVVHEIEPEAWSEHLAFVRGGGVEIGHLAAPPRTRATIDGLATNVARARARVGSTPGLENVATLLEPPGSDLDEAAFTRDALVAAGAPLLLDLHNLHANSTNFGFDATRFLREMPLDRLLAVHVAGGRRAGRVVDDHLHPVPDAVYVLLRETARLAPGPLTVVLERDGCFPPVPELLDELDRARAAVAAGREAHVVACV
jgi:hypothetical protein